MKYIIMVLLLATSLSAAAQPQFSYKVTYNSSVCAFEARLILTGGTFNGAVNTRIPSPSNFTIALPAAYGDAQFTITSLLPAGKVWTEGAGVRAPAANPSFDYHPISITGGGAANAYPTMNVGDELVLFRFTVSGNQCGAGVRPYINGGTPSGDPTSIQYLTAGDPGININNALEIAKAGGPVDYYVGNLASSTVPPSPTITSVTPSCSAGAVTMTATAAPGSACASPLTYAYTAPATATPTSSTNNPATFTGTPAQLSGNYALVVKDANGCAANFTETFNAVTCAPLPVTLTTFIATSVRLSGDCSVRVDWTAGTESNVDHYSIQCSATDGSGWATIGKMATANGGNGTNVSYRFVDASPMKGNSLYRLAITDYDGSVHYSATAGVSVDCGPGSTGITIYPNPATESVTVSGLSVDKESEVQISNALGQLVISNKVSIGATAQTIDVSALPNAVYMIQVIRNGAIVKTEKLVKQ